METLTANDIDLIQKQIVYVSELKRKLILKGKISLNEKDVVELELVSQTLAGFYLYVMGLKRKFNTILNESVPLE